MNTQSPTKKSNKGFISIYFIFILFIVISFTQYITNDLKYYLYYMKNLYAFRLMNNIEVLVVRKLIYDFRNFEEKSEILYYNDAIITIDIESSQATFTIYYDELYRERVLEYDINLDIAEIYY